jgi:ABC-2 type transport system ATP-binding protein
VAATVAGVEQVAIADDGLLIAADPDAAAAINRALVEAGIAVSELRPQRASLEQVFLELTQGGEEEA